MKRILTTVLIFLLFDGLQAQKPDSTAAKPQESDFFPITTLPIPSDVVLEVGGLKALPDGRLIVSTRRGEIWLVENPYMNGGSQPTYKRFAHGLHEVLGLAYKDGSIYACQRTEVTKLTDVDGDDKADKYEATYVLPLTGNYHEYAYGPVIEPNGDMLITLNLAFGPEGLSSVPWRGWMLRITPDGKAAPYAAGMRSPAGMGVNAEGDLFYSDNQGDWVGSGRITHVQQGDFVGNPGGLGWAKMPGSPVKLRSEDIPNTGRPMFEIAKEVPGIKTPAVWFPHGIMGNSTSDILLCTSKANIGPYEGQLFVGDQSQSKIMRASVEKIKGQYQGACFPFREGFSSGVFRMDWGNDGAMYVGMTSRGWASTGQDMYGLQKLSWSGKIPFEMKAITAKPDGFELEFTMPVDATTAKKLSAYEVTSFIYKYHRQYGSPVINERNCPVRAVVLSDDKLKVRLVLDSLREGYIHEIKLGDIHAASKLPLLHSVAYYTLNQLPDGEKIAVHKSVHPLHSAKASAQPTTTTTAAATKPNTREATAKRQTKMPASWTKGPDKSIVVGTKPGLKFDISEIVVKAGSRVKLTFTNTDDMQHNLVVVMPGKGEEVGRMALNMGLKGPAKEYVPETGMVLFYTKLLQPSSAETIYFTAPAKPGNYTYVCTYPGHYLVMKGILKVTN
ncbi:MAG TPA: plastocyanin/azurin family copper-binding protein [Chitinophagaceae bacterium]|nr:plastocyanin/azurin family copper-binding protein [Chitinophagaceae bacterium]